VLPAAIAVAALFGAFVGSFLNVCVHRLPRNESLIHPGSRCYACGTPVRWYDNLPILSWLILRGRCRWCRSPFSVRYLLVEALTALVVAGSTWLVLADLLGSGRPRFGGWLIVSQVPQSLIVGLVLASLLAVVFAVLVASLIDLEYRIIPDEITLPLLVLGPLAGVVLGVQVPGFGDSSWPPFAWFYSVSEIGAVRYDAIGGLEAVLWWAVPALVALPLSLPVARAIYRRTARPGEEWSAEDFRGMAIAIWLFVAIQALLVVVLVGVCTAHRGTAPGSTGPLFGVVLADAVLGGLAGWWILYGLGLVATVAFRRNAMGLGDVKFFAPLGAVIGYEGVLQAFFLAAILACAVIAPLKLLRAERELPFGPWLGIAAVIVALVGDRIHDHLAHLLGF